MSPIDELFRQLRGSRQKVLIPFLAAGDPTLQDTVSLVQQLPQLGCPLVELGFPYSDPIADGPVIQAAYGRALARGICVRDILQAIADIPSPSRPALAGMVSMAIIHRYGPRAFVQAAQRAGMGGLIVPDLPHEESQPLVEMCQTEGLSFIPLVTPTTSDERARRIVRTASGFIYFVSVTGITGERREIPSAARDRIRWLRHETDLPICVGFGVSTAEQVSSFAEVADGVIVGSAIIRRMASAHSPDEAIPDALRLIDELRAPLSVT